VSNLFGERLRVMTFGESHGRAVGCVVDGCPAGLPLRRRHIQRALARDVPIPEIGTTRREPNRARILSGIAEGKTLGTPIAIVIPNVDVDGRPYRPLEQIPRPGHAELTYVARHGHIDWKGGGRASGRECVARLAAGAIAKRLLAMHRVRVRSRVVAMAGVPAHTPRDLDDAVKRVLALAGEGESTGGIVHLCARGVPKGLGAPVFDKLSARLGHALLGIGGVKAIDIGAGRAAAGFTGSRNNDAILPRDGEAVPATNCAGGLLGGITTGQPLEILLWVKPVPSIPLPQWSVDLKTGTPVEVRVQGRFDLNIAPRVAVVAEAMTSLVLADALLEAGCIHPTRLAERGQAR
jgi:chorismate synthase